jgi:uncharacterized protein YkwD
MKRRTFLQAAFALRVPWRRDLADDEQRVFNAVNYERVKREVPALEWSDRLAQVARDQSERMLVLQFFGHQDPEYGPLTTRMALHGIQWSRCGENLFKEKGIDDPVPIAVVSWRYSTTGHYQTLLQPAFTHTGVGIAVTPDGSFYVTQVFLTPP